MTDAAAQRWHVTPRTRAGWLALALCGAFFVSIGVVAVFEPDGSIGQFNLWGALSFLLAVAGGALALYALFRDRALLLLLPMAPALLAVGFELVESLAAAA